jgi:hypothetical protein
MEMSSCCSSEKSACCKKEAVSRSCPSCGAQGTAVSTLTVKNLVRDHARVLAAGSYSFCATPTCEVVYFGAGQVYNRSDVKVRVGIKETSDPPLCYCFGYSEEDIRRDLESTGATEIPDRIKAETQAGFCACEVKNPSGRCCLGEVNSAVLRWRKK